MLTVEDVLACLVSRGRWFETTNTDKENPAYRKYKGSIANIEGALHEIRLSNARAIGIMIRDEREALGISVQTLADTLGKPASTIRFWESGRAEKIERSDLDAVSRTLSCPELTNIGRSAQLPKRPTATGTETKPNVTGGSLHSILAGAIAGMPAIEWAAILWILDKHIGSYERMHSRLLSTARRSYGKDAMWPSKIGRKPRHCEPLPAEDYVPDLVTLALLELQAPSQFQTHQQRADWFRTSASNWRRQMLAPYGLLKTCTFRWFGGGCSHIARRIGQSEAA